MQENGTYACGTARIDRKGFPSELSDDAKRLQRGEHVFRQSKTMVATVWKDTKEVKMLSTMTNAEDTSPVVRKQKDGREQQFPCPL